VCSTFPKQICVEKSHGQWSLVGLLRPVPRPVPSILRNLGVEGTIRIRVAGGNSCLRLVTRVFGGDKADEEARNGTFLVGSAGID